MVKNPKTSFNAEGGREEGNRRQFTTTTDAYAHDVYRDAVEDHDIHKFMRETGIYDFSHRRWFIPDFLASNDNLLGSVFKVCSAIVRRFARCPTSRVERNVVSSNEIQRVEQENDTEPRELPSLVVQAAGPSFQTPSVASSTLGSTESLGVIGYTNIASYLILKVESEIGTAAENIEETEVHARQIFRVQPNRSYVRALVLTEKHVRLVHFDRAGSQVTPLVDIHQHPETLVRLVAGLSSTDERLLGLDDSVKWAVVNGKKTQGRVTTTGPTGEVKTYPIVGQIPVPRHSICSRGTTRWRVCDPETSEEYVIKDSWREDDLPAEHELLERVKDIAGVVHMVSCEADRGGTKDFRCASTLHRYQNRKASRVIMKSYGKPVEYFSSMLQVLFAFRDAIVAHQRLLERGVLHRDISLNNILFGKPDAPEGERGVLIDLDLAFLATEAKHTVKTDYTIGTRLFQSIPVLRSCELRERAWEHDYLDDLEAFLYSFAFIVLCYRPDGRPIPIEEEGPSIPWSWAKEVPGAAREVKYTFFGAGTIVFDSSRIVRTRWCPACGTLLDNFRQWIFRVRAKKGSLIVRAGGNANPLLSLHSCRDEHYAAVVNMFDEAIGGVQSSASPPPSPPVVETPKHVERNVPVPSVQKRRRKEAEHPEPPIPEVQRTKKAPRLDTTRSR